MTNMESGTLGIWNMRGQEAGWLSEPGLPPINKNMVLLFVVGLWFACLCMFSALGWAWDPAISAPKNAFGLSPHFS